MTSFRFLHTADIHLDSPLLGLVRQEGTAAERIRNATREAFEGLIERAVEERVSFLVIAGDLYDGNWRDYKTGLYFVRQMGRLREAGIPVYLLYGNHDAESQITRRLTLPDNVHVFGTRQPESFRIDDLDVVLHGQSYRRRDVSENLAQSYPQPVVGTFNIGVLHTGLGGMGGHANYAPCSLDDLINKGYDYWALGHVHRAQVLHEQPYIVFPGNLQGRHVREDGAKGAYLVAVENNQVAQALSVHTDVVRWAVLHVSLNKASSVDDAVECMRGTIEDAVSSIADGRLLACRIELRGRTEAHGPLLAAEARLLAEARACAQGIGDDAAWVEKVVVATDPVAGPAALAEREDALGELQLMLGKASADDALVEQLKRDVGELTRRLPHEARTEVEDKVLRAAIDDDYAGLIDLVTPYLSARLLAEER